MSEPTPEDVQQAMDSLPQLPRLLPVLNANMDPMEMVAFGEQSEKYQVDSDFHFLIDTVFNLLTTIGELEGKIERLANREKT